MIRKGTGIVAFRRIGTPMACVATIAATAAASTTAMAAIATAPVAAPSSTAVAAVAIVGTVVNTQVAKGILKAKDAVQPKVQCWVL